MISNYYDSAELQTRDNGNEYDTICELEGLLRHLDEFPPKNQSDHADTLSTRTIKMESDKCSEAMERLRKKIDKLEIKLGQGGLKVHVRKPAMPVSPRVYE